MSRKAFNRIAEGLNEAIAIARGEAEPSAMIIPAEIDVNSIRAKVGLSQDAFARVFGFTINQIRDWEQGRARPLGGVRAYLMMIDGDPQAVRRILDTIRRDRAA